MKIFVITGRGIPVSLAEVRTDGTRLEFVVDNTKGMLPSLVQGSFTRLKSVVEASSYLSMDHSTEATAQLVRYLLSNGDTVEITTDGKTAILNNTLLSDAQKGALFDALKAGHVQVADASKGAIPILPDRESRPIRRETRPDHPGLMRKIAEGIAADRKRERACSVYYDSTIEDARYPDRETKDLFTKMLYWLKYGKGRQN